MTSEKTGKYLIFVAILSLSLAASNFGGSQTPLAASRVLAGTLKIRVRLGSYVEKVDKRGASIQQCLLCTYYVLGTRS